MKEILRNLLTKKSPEQQRQQAESSIIEWALKKWDKEWGRSVLFKSSNSGEWLVFRIAEEIRERARSQGFSHEETAVIATRIVRAKKGNLRSVNQKVIEDKSGAE